MNLVVNLHFLLALSALGLTTTTYSQQTFKTEQLSATRAQIVLNGIWQFQPITKGTSNKTSNNWANIRVPGAWEVNDVWWSNVPGLINTGATASGSVDLKDVSQAWYRQQVQVPAQWKTSAVMLDLDRVSTDAQVFINGNSAGTIAWYSGTVNITPWIKFGKTNEILIRVMATPNEGEVAQLMGTAESQVTFAKATLATKGITGNVVMFTQPRQEHITDVFVKTSTRKSTIETEVEVSDINTAALWLFKSEVVDNKGQLVKTFEKRISLSGANKQIISFSANWNNPELWELENPNMYTVKVSMYKNNKLQDTYIQTFGFREFWIDGKNFYLNGTRLNLRPAVGVPGDGMEELIAGGINGLKKNGFNFSELWPNNFDQRGYVNEWHEIMKVADRKGYLLSGVALPFQNYIVDNTWSYQWDKPGVKETWEKRMLFELRRQRNHPSIILWGTSANFFGHPQDQNPLHIGQVNWVKGNSFWQRNADAAKEAIATIKRHDATRPVYTHHGAYVGDIHTLNFYLDLIPLQEREEWMSHYSKFGKIPFIGIEFGTPLHCTFLRGRNGFGNNVQTEPLVTEFAAMYTGPSAYFTETGEYRSLIKNNFLGGQKYKSWTGPVEMERLPAFQELQHLFSKNTWRSYRTYEVTGGMIPWNNGHGWIPGKEAGKKVAMKTFEPGRKGNYFNEGSADNLQYLQPKAYQITKGGKAIVENNSEILAYIANGGEAFTAKDHHYKPGDFISKQFFFFNDTRKPQVCSWKGELIIEGKKVYSVSDSTYIPVGEKGSVPFHCQLPINQQSFKQEGQIILTSVIGSKTLEDSFSIQIVQPELSRIKQVFVYDPEGTTSNVFTAAGIDVKKWDGKTRVPFLIVGRNAMLQQYKMPFKLEEFIADGGKVLMMNQHPDSFAVKKGFRVSQYISRYVFPVDKEHPLFTGLDEADFRNWSGVSKLAEAYPDYINSEVRFGSHEIPYYGWHWGNRGGVATGAIEKPHHSAWRPLMQCEFDMAYSPLNELPYKKGQLVWCQLDLEDHYNDDVIASTMMTRLLNYIDTLHTKDRTAATVLLGNKEDEALLLDLGMQFTKSDVIPSNAGLLIVGNISGAQQGQVKQFATAGGKVLVLAGKKGEGLFGVQYKLDSNFKGAYQLPQWTATQGLSVSDTRYRVNYPTWLISGGCEIAASGMIGKLKVGTGEMVFVQFDPQHLPADTLTYLRFTRWRQTRALVQVAANMGASFIMDRALFETPEKQVNSVLIEGDWKTIMTKPLPASRSVEEKYKDTGITAEALKYMQTEADETGMISIKTGVSFEAAVPAWNDKDGEIVYRKIINMPSSLIGQELLLHLGVVDDYDDVYINGKLIGKSGIEKEPVWNYNRTYTIPAGVLKEGANVMAIRIFDTYGGGGIMPSLKRREFVLKVPKKIPQLYNRDYIDDFEMGDDPFRYFRW